MRLFHLGISILVFLICNACAKEPNKNIPATGTYYLQDSQSAYGSTLNIQKDANAYILTFTETKNGTATDCIITFNGTTSGHGIKIAPDIHSRPFTLLVRQVDDNISVAIKGPEDLGDDLNFCNSNHNPLGTYANTKPEVIEIDETALFMEYSIDDTRAEEIATYIRKTYFNNQDLSKLSDFDRQFQIYNIDLNKGDDDDETFVRLYGKEFCGSGGCTFLLLDKDNNLITKFTVTRSPFFVSQNQMTQYWRNIMVKSEGEFRELNYNGKGYPSNPSILPPSKFAPSGHDEIIFDDENYPAKTYKF